jgi:uncharacterized membrane protein
MRSIIYIALLGLFLTAMDVKAATQANGNAYGVEVRLSITGAAANVGPIPVSVNGQSPPNAIYMASGAVDSTLVTLGSLGNVLTTGVIQSL